MKQSTVLSAIAVAAATWLGSEFGHLLRFPDSGTAILFPPYGVLTAALLLSPPRRWWIYFAASFVGHMAAASSVDIAYTAFTVSTEVANAVRALVVALTLRAVLGQERVRLDTFEDAVVFLTVAGLLGPAVGAFVGAAATSAFGRSSPGMDSHWQVWTAWFLSNAIIGVTLLPLFLSMAGRIKDWRRRYSPARLIELASLVAALGVVSVTALTGTATDHVGMPARLAAPLPFLLWAGMRFGTGVTSASLIIVASAAIAGVITGQGPFAATPTDDGVFSLYLFLAFVSVPCILLAVLVREREQVLSAVREGEERYRLASSAATVGVWDWTLATNEMYVDPVMKRAIGYTEDEIENSIEDWNKHLHPADLIRAQAAAENYFAGRAPAFEAEYRVIHKSGGVRWFMTRGAAVPDGDGVARRLLGTTIDITDRKRAELELEERRRELAHLGRVATIGQLSGAVAHELRQPLTAILTNTQTALHLLSKRRPDLDEVREILHDIEHDDMRAGDVIIRLRRLLKKGEAAFEAIHLSDVVQGSLDIAHSDLVARGVAVEREFDQSLPPVHGDRVELEQVLVNLVLNACEAMVAKPPGERRLKVGTRPGDSGFVVAYVVDRGTGIVQNDPEQVFEPFVTSKGEGLGLGLAICRTIAAAHEGRLWGANNQDGGATFYLALPPSPLPAA